MPSFVVEATDRHGNRFHSVVTMHDEKSLVSAFKKLNYTIVSIQREKVSLRSRLSLLIDTPLSVVIMFSKQLSVLLQAGIPFVLSLHLLSKSEENKRFASILERIEGLVRMGSAPSEAFSQFPNAFSKVFVAMIKAGELSGLLPEVLDRVAAYQERQLVLKRKIKAALTYPAFIAVTFLILLYVIFVRIFPGLANLFRDLNVTLPWFTRILLRVGQTITSPYFFAFFFLVLGAAVVFFKFLQRTKEGKRVIDTLKLSLPVLNTVTKNTLLSRFSTTIGTLYSTGIPVLTAVTLADETCDNLCFSEVVSKPLHAALKEGEVFTKVFSNNPLIPRLVTSMVSVGEYTGDLPGMFEQIAEFYDAKLAYHLQRLAASVEPILILALGAFVGASLLATWVPIYRIIAEIR